MTITTTKNTQAIPPFKYKCSCDGGASYPPGGGVALGSDDGGVALGSGDGGVALGSGDGGIAVGSGDGGVAVGVKVTVTGMLVEVDVIVTTVSVLVGISVTVGVWIGVISKVAQRKPIYRRG